MQYCFRLFSQKLPLNLKCRLLSALSQQWVMLPSLVIVSDFENVIVLWSAKGALWYQQLSRNEHNLKLRPLFSICNIWQNRSSIEWRWRNVSRLFRTSGVIPERTKKASENSEPIKKNDKKLSDYNLIMSSWRSSRTKSREFVTFSTTFTEGLCC